MRTKLYVRFAAIIVLVVLALAACGSGGFGKLINVSDLGQSWDGTIPKLGSSGESIQVPDYRQLWASEDAPNIRFWNPDDNNVLLYYVVDCQGETIWETTPIQAGTSLYFNAMEQFHDPGEYILQVKVYTFSEDQEEAYNGALQEASLKIY